MTTTYLTQKRTVTTRVDANGTAAPHNGTMTGPDGKTDYFGPKEYTAADYAALQAMVDRYNAGQRDEAEPERARQWGSRKAWQAARKRPTSKAAARPVAVAAGTFEIIKSRDHDMCIVDACVPLAMAAMFEAIWQGWPK